MYKYVVYLMNSAKTSIFLVKYIDIICCDTAIFGQSFVWPEACVQRRVAMDGMWSTCLPWASCPECLSCQAPFRATEFSLAAAQQLDRHCLNPAGRRSLDRLEIAIFGYLGI